MNTLQKIQILAGVAFFAFVCMGFSIAEIAHYLNQESILTNKDSLLLLMHGIWIAIWSFCIIFTFRLTFQKPKNLPGKPFEQQEKYKQDTILQTLKNRMEM